MPNFTPEGIIKIGRVPFDNSYRHTLTFANVEAQTAYFASVCTESLSGNDYTYVRMNNSIRVPFNAERLYTYDYVMYQNKNYGTKWFYAFIVAVNYVNENVTELVLQLDVMQTWYFDYTLVEGFIEREHVNDDTIGAHINDEPGLDLKYIYDNFIPHIYDYSNSLIVLLTNAYPNWNTTTSVTGIICGSVPLVGEQYSGQYNGCKALVYRPQDSNSIAQFKRDIEDFNKAGCADSIVDCYMVPSECFGDIVNGIERNLEVFSFQNYIGTTITRDYVYTPKSSLTALEKSFTLSRQYTLNGYTPRNKKLLCYPYSYVEVGDFSGRKQDYRWEFFDNVNPSHVTFYERKAGISDGQGYVQPYNYNGISHTVNTQDAMSDVPFTYDYNNKISWVYSTFQNWLAQNSLNNQLAVIGSVGAMITGLNPGISAAVSTLGKGAQIASSHLSKGLNLPAQRAMNAYADTAITNLAEKSNNYMVGGGLAGLAGYAGNVSKMSRIPNQAKGNIAGNSKYQTGYCGWYMAAVSIRYEFAQIMDDFFDCYGYAIERVKIPNRTGRRSWNYVKMQNACHRGTVPASDMEMINNIYNAGITFWHTSDVGNYSLDNSIVT